MTESQVLICGAGPAGLVLALWLQRFQIPFRIIDKASTPGLTSRATIVQSRVLEFYRQLGIINRILAAGHKFEGVCVSHRGHVRGYLKFNRSVEDLTMYPYSFVLAQDTHEEILNKILIERGITIERSVELVDAVQSQNGVDVTIRHLSSEKREHITVEYLNGCDGARSLVRKIAGVSMDGGTYGKKFYVADVFVDPRTPMRQTPGFANMNISPSDSCMMIPMKGQNHCRLVGSVPKALAEKSDLSWEDMEPTLCALTGIEYKGANWFSTYNLHHRVANKFRVDRIFLCGDACHLHSPAGGQGMNAGIGDSTNLAWKLAAVLRKTSPESILSTYEPERQDYAKLLVKTTDTMYNYLSGATLIGWFFRAIVLSYVLPFLTRFVYVRRNMFMTVAQMKIAYTQSSLSTNSSGLTLTKIQAGNRLPWVYGEGKQVDNFTSLDTCTWQVHVYGRLETDIAESLQTRGIQLNVFPWSEIAERAGLKRDVIYLLRPDGHIGWMGGQSDENGLVGYLDKWLLGNMVMKR